MEVATHVLSFDGAVLQRGFWLYVWKITPLDSAPVYYVGRTGDSSSPNAQSPFNRVGQHLGFNRRSNALRRHLEARGLIAEECQFEFIAHGPILPEEDNMEDHRQSRDVVAALEKGLCDFITATGADVLNVVHCRRPIDEELFSSVRKAFHPFIQR